MKQQKERVVITGMGILCALGHQFPQVLEQMRAMKTGIAKVKKFDTSKFHSQIGAEVKSFPDDKIFRQQQERQIDLCAQYAIYTAKQALQDSGLEIHRTQQTGMGLVLGTCNGGIITLEEQGSTKKTDERIARYPYYQQADDVASFLQLNGPVATINTACAASGNAIAFAYELIRSGYTHAMLAGGSDPFSHAVYAGFNVLRALGSEPTAPFGNRYGLSLGEGASFVVLESLSSAIQRGAHIYAEICGYGLSNDGYHETASDPEGQGIQLAVQMALRQAGVRKDQIGYINAHGTGTKTNDIAEMKGLTAVFGKDGLPSIPINSSKAYFGHNLGAAAAIELTTALYALKHGLMPATLHHEQAREGCEHADIIANEMRAGTPEYILSNNSAFGGHNVSIVAKPLYQSDKKLDQEPAMAAAEPPAANKVVIVGIGQVSPLGALQGGGLNRLGQAAAQLMQAAAEHEQALSFSLKDFHPALYERRMNRLCQYSIGAGHLAMLDAGWSTDEEPDSHIGLVYGTSRGSLDNIDKYLSSVFEQGPEYASSIYFPYNVINSISGKMAQKLKLKGFSSSLSTGGNEGLHSVLYGAEAIQNGTQQKCIVGAGDEASALSTAISEAKGLHTSRFPQVEGSCCIALADGAKSLEDGSKMYAEIKSFGLSFHGAAQQPDARLPQAVMQALARAQLQAEQIDFVLLNSLGRPGELEQELQQLSSFTAQDIPLICFNEHIGYGESLSSLQHLAMAAEMIYTSQQDVLDLSTLTNLLNRSQLKQNVSFTKPLQYGLVISSSVNGNQLAVIIGACSEG